MTQAAWNLPWAAGRPPQLAFWQNSQQREPPSSLSPDRRAGQALAGPWPGTRPSAAGTLGWLRGPGRVAGPFQIPRSCPLSGPWRSLLSAHQGQSFPFVLLGRNWAAFSNHL